MNLLNLIFVMPDQAAISLFYGVQNQFQTM